MNVKAVGKNKTGRNVNITRYIFIAVLFITIEGLFQYFMYHYFSYIKLHPKDSIILSIIKCSETLFQETTPINFNIVKELGYFNIKIWYVHILLIIVFLLNFRRYGGDYKGVEYGSAEWASQKDRKQFKNTAGNGIPIAKGMYIDPKDTKLNNLNELVIGGSGSGKTFRKIKADILQMLGSYIITDPKGELYRDLAKMLRANGYKIKVLNLLNELEYSNTYNPLYYVRKEKDAYTLAETFIKNSTKGSNESPFWEDAIRLLFQACVLYLYKEPNERKTFGRILELLTGIKVNKNTGEILQTCEIERIMKKLEIKDELDPAVASYKQFKNSAGDTLKDIVISLAVRLTLWNSKDINILTSSDEMELDKIGEEKMAIFLLISDTDTTFKVIASMFFTQFFQLYCYNADMVHQGATPIMVSCEIDEFANIGQIPNFKEIISTIRSRNGRIVPVIQAVSQLRDIYKDATDTIIANCCIKNFLGSSDEKTQKFIINLLGNTTVQVESTSKSQGSTQGSSSASISHTRRELMTPDELNLLARRNNSIVHIEGYRPFFCEKYDTPNHPRFKETGGNPRYVKDPAILANNSDLHVDYAELAKIHTQEFEEYIAKRRADKNKSIVEMMKEEEERQKKIKEEMDAEFGIGEADEAYNSKLNTIEKLKNINNE